jgi:hypothetical protein
MLGRVAASIMIAFGMVGIASAQQAPPEIASPSPQSSQTQNSAARSLPQRIQQKLTSQGFSNVKVAPEGFIVTAKDRDGDPVTMIIGPESTTMFVMMPGSAGTTEHRSSSDSQSNPPSSSGTR